MLIQLPIDQQVEPSTTIGMIDLYKIREDYVTCQDIFMVALEIGINLGQFFCFEQRC